MTYFIIILILLIIIFLLYQKRKKWAIKKVNCETEEKKLKEINDILNPFGFEFNLNQDIVISKNDSWQRNMGYKDNYDLKAPFFSIVMDAEPIYFDYNNKHYRLEFWKGQYGITTGAEIGLYIQEYNCKKKKHYYRSANDDERLEMGFSLFKNCYLFSCHEFSWWLAGFDIGNFSKPKELKLKACINFPNKEMQIAFVNGLLNAGYCNCVCINICQPQNYKLNHHHKILKHLVQIINYLNCSFYMFFTRYFNRTLDKLTFLRFMAPHLYKYIIHLCIPHKKTKKCY